MLSPVKTLNSPGKVLENDLKKSWKVLEFKFAVSVATLDGAYLYAGIQT